MTHPTLACYFLILCYILVMAKYIRWFKEGGTYFFTVKTFNRQRLFSNETARQFLREAIQETQRQMPFDIPAIVLLPDHIHTIWRMPENDQIFSARWGCIKRRFTKRWSAYSDAGPTVSHSRKKRKEHGVWQRRFWEHLIRDRDDYAHHMDYIHYNPIKHDLVECPHQWPHSSFHHWVKEGAYSKEWLCSCKGKTVAKPKFLDIITNEQNYNDNNS